MLLERATDLATQIAEYKALKGAADNAAQFHTRAKQFTDLSKRISDTRAALEALEDASVDVSFAPTDGVGHATKAETLRAALRDSPTAINDPPFDLKHEFMDRISGIVAAADGAMIDAWKTYVAKRADFGANDVLSTLAEVPQFRSVVSKIRQIRNNIADLGADLPTDPRAAVVRIDTLVSEHNAAWATLSAESIPSTVISFIRAATNEGAPLNTYSDELRAWFESQNLLDAFRIKLR